MIVQVLATVFILALVSALLVFAAHSTGKRSSPTLARLAERSRPVAWLLGLADPRVLEGLPEDRQARYQRWKGVTGRVLWVYMVLLVLVVVTVGLIGIWRPL